MSPAFTVRIRSLASGAHVMAIAPAAGFGFSKECCTDGHPSPGEALSHGLVVLAVRFSDELTSAA